MKNNAIYVFVIQESKQCKSISWWLHVCINNRIILGLLSFESYTTDVTDSVAFPPSIISVCFLANSAITILSLSINNFNSLVCNFILNLLLKSILSIIWDSRLYFHWLQNYESTSFFQYSETAYFFLKLTNYICAHLANDFIGWRNVFISETAKSIMRYERQ